MNSIRTIALKELKYFFNSSLVYMAIIPFIFISYFLYFRTTLIVGIASLRPFFDILPWFLIILIPALTLQTLSEEKNRKTLELILAHPVSELELVLGKFLGTFIFYVIILFTTTTLIIPLIIFSRVDPGIILSQYLGALFIGGAFLSVGIFASSLVSNMISSFLLAASLSFLLIISGLDFVVLSLPKPLDSLISFVSITKHSQSISRGLLDVSDLIYFVTITLIFVILAVFKVSKTKITEKKSEESRIIISLIIALSIGVLLNLLSSSYHFRLDLTSGKLFTLSKATKSSVAKIDDTLNIKVFASPDLPPSMHTVAQEVRDLVSDYARYNNKITVGNYSPKNGNDHEKEAQSLGITPVQFNTIAASSYQLQKGYLGLSLRFGDKIETLPFIQNSQNLEYQLTTRINKITTKSPLKIGLYSGSTTDLSTPPLESNQLEFNHLAELLGSQYDVEAVKLDKSLIDSKINLLIMAGLTQPLSNQELEIFKLYTKNSGKSLLLLDKVSNSNGGQTAQIKTTNLEAFLSDYGVNLNSDIVYDLSLAETIQFSQGATTFLATYPFWFKSLPAEPKLNATADVKTVTLLWPSSLTVDKKEDYDTRIILTSSKNADVKKESNLNVSPDNLNNLNLKGGSKELALAALVSHKNAGNVFAVIADSKFASDRYYSPANQNLAFVVGLSDHLILSGSDSVPLRSGGEEFLVFNAPWQPIFVQWGETAGVPVMIGVFAIWHLWRRRSRSKRIYEKLV